MAMSRSMGGSSFTTLSPMRISPDVIDSRPATMRSVVVLPQPEGPTRTTNSLSRMSRFTSLTAWTSSYVLFSSLSTTCAIAASRAGAAWLRAPPRGSPCSGRASSLDRARQAGDVVLHEEREDERIDELVPGQREGEDPGRKDARHGERKDDVDHRFHARGAVDAGAFLELARDRLEIAHHQPGAERDEEGRVGQDQRPGRVAEPEVADDVGERNEQEGLRHQIGDEDPGPEAAGEGKVQPRQGLAGEKAAKE